MSDIDAIAERERNLHSFTLRLAERLYLAAEVISILAEKKNRRRLLPGDRGCKIEHGEPHAS